MPSSDSAVQRPRSGLGKYLRAHHFTRAGLIAAGLGAAFAFFFVGAAIRLLIGPIALGPFSGTLSNALADALPGVSVKYDQAAVEWSRDEGRVGLVILGARVFDTNGRIIAQAPKAAIDLSARSIFSGHPEVRRITLIGVQLTLVRTRDGGLRLGVGNDIGEHDFLTNITDAITATSSKTSALQAFAVKQARVAFLDEVTGLFVVAPSADMTIATAGPSISATLAAEIEISGRPARVHADLTVPPKKGPVNGDITISGLDVGALGANAKMFALLKGIGLGVDMSASFTIDHGAHLSAADFGLDAHGTVGAPGIIAGPVHVRSAKIVGRYDGNAGRLLIDDASLKSDQASLHLIGGAVLVYDADHALSQVDFDSTADNIAVIGRGTLQQPVSFRRMAVRGSYLLSTRDIVLDHFGLEGGPFQADVSGKISVVPGQSPAIALTGKVAAMSIHDFLRYWPLTTGSGAREWIDHNLTAGSVGPIALETHLAAGALNQPGLPDGALHLVMPLSGVEMIYIKGLTHLTQLSAVTTLGGNSYTAVVNSARVGPLVLSNGLVSIPDLSVHGSPADISAHVTGTLTDVLKLVDEKPLNYPTKFGIDPVDTTGNAALDLSAHLPLLKDLTVDQIAIGAKAVVTNFDIALGSRGRLTDGVVNFDINNDRLIAMGTASVADSHLAITWNEDFKSAGPITTKVSVKGPLRQAAREAFNLHTGQYLQGAVGIDASLVGRHGHFSRADVALDLGTANVALDLIGIEKPQGVPGNGNIVVQFWPDSSVKSEDIRFSAPAGTFGAQLAYAKDGTLQSLAMPAVKYGNANDFSFHLAKVGPSTEVTIRGHSLDGSAIAHEGEGGDSADTNLFDGPFHISAKLDRLVLREGVTVVPLSLDVSGNGQHLTAMALAGSMGRNANLSGSVIAANGSRRLAFATDDAGQLARGLFGLTGMKGGALDVSVALPGSGNDRTPQDTNAPDFQGTIGLKDATLSNQPFVARLLSMASFAGIGNLFGGSGLQIDHLDVPFSSKNGVISVHDAAASGPTIGVTADGYVDRPQNAVAIKGSLIPVIGADFNKVLGAIPLLGNIMVSKKGEGIFGVTYSVSGNADQPSVSVNPLSMLTPGILRRLFQGRMPTAAQAPTNTEPATAPNAPASKATVSSLPPPAKGQ